MPPDPIKKSKCPDCYQCQMCSKGRCRLCRKTGPTSGAHELESNFTYGQYLKWRREKSNPDELLRRPVKLHVCPEEDPTEFMSCCADNRLT